MSSIVSAEINESREKFFLLAFGPSEGYVCLAWLAVKGRGMEEKFYAWPNELPRMLEDINMHGPGYNSYFCTQLLRTARFTHG